MAQEALEAVLGVGDTSPTGLEAASRGPDLPWDQRLGTEAWNQAAKASWDVTGDGDAVLTGQLDPGPSILVLQEAGQVWTALQAGRELAACRSVGQQGRGRTGDRLHGAPGWKGLGHRYVDMTVGRKVSSLWAPCPLGSQPLLHAHLQAGVEDEGAVVQFTARDVSPKASWLSVSENVS